MQMNLKFVSRLFVLVVLVGCGGSNTKSGPVDPELERLQGSWQQQSSVAAGAPLPAAAMGEIRMTIQGDKKSVQMGSQVITSNVLIEIDSSTTPKIWDEKPANSSVIIRGIYKLDDDTLTRCIAAANEDRPTQFESPRGGGFTLQVFRRVKAGNP
jgi:uncharacterized protein (TIGR03067 family)